MLKIGLTGRIASGKSTVANLFRGLGVYLISADEINRLLILPGKKAYQEIVTHFGKTILKSSGHLDKKKLRQIIFNNPDQKKWLEQLLHPSIQQTIKSELETISGPYAMVEIPLLTNLNHYPFLNRILFIQTSKKIQLTRVMDRDSHTELEALKIIDTQPDEKEYISIADDLIINNTSLAQLESQVNILHKKYLQMAQHFK